MSKSTLLIFSALFFSSANSQVTKGNWLLGGNASFTSDTRKSYDVISRRTSVGISPAVGYFIIDKLATGVRLDISFHKAGNGLAYVTNSQYIIGPFLRYYFLEENGMVNLFTESNFAYGIGKANNATTTNKFYKYSFLAGPVIYLNSSVGLEFTLGYYREAEVKVDASNHGFMMGLGLQIHLERDK